MKKNKCSSANPHRQIRVDIKPIQEKYGQLQAFG